MEKFSPSSKVDFSKPPVPRARPPIRNTNVPGENDPYTLRSSEYLMTKNTMYKNKGQIEEFLSVSHGDLQCTDDEDDDVENSSNNGLLNASSNNLSTESFNTPHNSPLGTHVYKRSYRSLNASHSLNVSNNSFSCKVQNQQDKSLGKFNMFPCICICTVLFLIAVFLSTQTISHKDHKAISDTEKVDLATINNVLDTAIQKIQTKFHNQRTNIWNDISAAIYDVALYPTKPSIIILFGNKTETLNCLAQLLGQLSGKILGTDDYLMLTPIDFPDNVGQTIHRFKAQILEKKAVVVRDLLSINAEGVKAFHNFCDRENPLVKHSIYIITITVDGYKSSQRELEFIEKQIFISLSNFIDKDILDPLITRITDGIIVSVAPESNRNFDDADCSLFKNKKL